MITYFSMMGLVMEDQVMYQPHPHRICLLWICRNLPAEQITKIIHIPTQDKECLTWHKVLVKYLPSLRWLGNSTELMIIKSLHCKPGKCIFSTVQITMCQWVIILSVSYCNSLVFACICKNSYWKPYYNMSKIFLDGPLLTVKITLYTYSVNCLKLTYI